MEKKAEDFIAGEATPIVNEVAKACVEICAASISEDAKQAIANLKIVKASEVTVESTGKKAIVIVIPYNAYKLHVKPALQRVIPELEKKTKRHVVIIAARTMMKPGAKKSGLRIRPRSRTLTSVQASILEDIVAPSEIVGKRIRVRTDGSQQLRIALDPKDKNKDNIDEKLSAYSAVYKALTTKVAEFEFPEYVIA